MTADANGFVLDLYRAGLHVPHAELRPWVFAALRELLHFDSAVWLRRSGGPGRPSQDGYAFRQPETFLAEYAALELWTDDESCARQMPDPCFRPVRTPCIEGGSEGLRHLMKRHRLEHRLTGSVSGGATDMVDGVSLFRNEASLPFSDEEAATMEQLMPLVVYSWRESRLRDVARAANSEPAFDGFSIAVLGSDLAVSESQASFTDLMRLEWPRWQGPTLPDKLAGQLRGAALGPWSCKSIAVYVRRQCDGTLLLLARRAHTLDGLAPRKRLVASLFSRGSSQTQIARQLRLSPSTVNNYIGIVYEKLDLRGKTDLSRLFMRLEP
jgi:DNA-binding CsgD family transcriptional regulator